MESMGWQRNLPAPLVMMYPASAHFCDVHCQRFTLLLA